jgi:hypothetical protein
MKKLTRRFGIAALVLTLATVALASIGCTPPAAPTTVNVNVSNSATIVFGQPVEATKSGCKDIGSIKVERPEILAVKGTERISATPKDPEGNDRPASCDVADGINWSVSATDLAEVEDPKAFVTNIAGKKAGDVVLNVTVGKASGSVRIRVQ